ncbi:MAG: STAS/SEC14 domain-containing protein [Chitinophagaceae bacterium]
MLRIINDLPGNVLGIEAEGEVTGSDYENVLIPAVDEKLKANEKIRFLYYLGPDFTGFSLEAMIDDAKVGMKNFSTWDRVALVSNHQLINGFAKLFGYLLPGEVKVYGNAELDEAKKWIAE